MKKRTRTKLELWLIILATGIIGTGLIFNGIYNCDVVPIIWGTFFSSVSILFIFVEGVEKNGT